MPSPVARTCWIVFLALLAWGSSSLPTGVADADGPAAVQSTTRWPMWRADAGRSGSTPVPMPKQVHMHWVQQLPPPAAAFRSVRLQFDAAYEPVIADGICLVGSMHDDALTAFDVLTGEQRWVFHTNGPIRCAPAIWQNRVFVGSDDGMLYTLNLKDGRLLAQQQLAIGPRLLLGNGRLTSVWPVRGGPVVHNGKVYVACGVWPSEGVFLYCFDAKTGQEVWHNDRLGYLFGGHPHNAEAFGGLAPQGYLLVDGDSLVVPCSTAYPGRVDLETGKLIEFQLPLPGRKPGGWFAALDAKTQKSVRRGEIQFDREVNVQDHEDGPRQSGNTNGARRQITCAGETIRFDDERFPKEYGAILSLAVTDQMVVATTDQGAVLGLNAEPADAIRHEPKNQQEGRAANAIGDSPSGYALLMGADTANWAIRSAEQTNAPDRTRHWIAFVDDRDEAKSLRKRTQHEANASPSGGLAVWSDLGSFDALPPHFASEIYVTTNEASTPKQVALWLRSLRPFGGRLLIRGDSGTGAKLQEVTKDSKEANFRVTHSDGWTVVTKEGPLVGAADYRGKWQATHDALVRAPLGVLWFDDRLGHFKRSPQPAIVRGVMVSFPKDWHAPRVRGEYKTDYPLLKPVFSDIYTGRVLSDEETQAWKEDFPQADPKRREPSQYRPPHQKDAWKPKQPQAGDRVNPLTGKAEPRVFPKSYGCDGGVDYGYLYSMRSGTAAFYDKTLESGTICISGPRSGCTNSIIPAGGILNVPYFYEGCTCSYPLPSGLALYSLPESYEQWASWGKGDATDIQRIGINLAAPGDRMTRDGTLWLEHPSVGGASPEAKVTITPDEAVEYRYQHSGRITQPNKDAWPWVAASEAVGLRRLTISGLRNGTWTAKLVFSNVNLGEQPDAPVSEMKWTADGTTKTISLRRMDQSSSYVLRFQDVLVSQGSASFTVEPMQGKTRLSGVELIRISK